MTAPRDRRLVIRLVPLLALLAAGQVATAQPLPPFPPNPLAPTLRPVMPLGMQRGTTLELTLTGTNLAGPTGLWTSFPAKVTIPTASNNGKDPAKLTVQLEVPKDAPLGFHAVRLATNHGMSNVRLFCLDDLVQVLENNANHTVAMAQPVTPPCVVVGRADAEATDYFKVPVAAGQRLAFEVLGRRLGSAFDPQLTLFDAKTGRELSHGYSNDAPGLQTDARIVRTFKEAGEVIVAIRDLAYRGGDDFVYRLRIGDFPCATTPLPLAVKRGSKTQVRFTGPAVEGVPPVEVTAPTDPNVENLWVSPRGASGISGWPVSLALSDLDETVEQEPNNDPAKANRVPVPGAVTGRLQDKGDVDHYIFTLKKGIRYIIEAHTHELHAPSEVDLVLRDTKGNQVQASAPAGPARLDFTPPADGDYVLVVTHLHSWGGPDECYRVTITPYEPGFTLTLPTDHLDMPPGGAAGLPVYLVRRDYTGPIELSVVGAAGVTATATIGAGTAPPPNVPAATLVLTAGADQAPGPRLFRVQTKATINGKAVVDFATVRPAVSQALGALPVPPRALYHEVALAITEKPPFLLAVKFDQPAAAPGKPAILTITATRQPGFTGEIALTATGLPPNVAPALKNITANTNEVKAQLNLAANAPLGQFAITINGKAKHQMRDWSVNAAPAQLVIKK